MCTTQKIRAIYRNGSFIPQSSYSLPNDTEVELLVKCHAYPASDSVDPETRRKILRNLLERMRQRRQ